MIKLETSARQQEIIVASGNILITKGIKALTTKNLAAEMGFSESAIYRHFSNKEDILIALFRSILENFERRLTPIISQDLNAIEKLNAIFDSQCLFFSQNAYYTIAVLADEIYYEGERVKDALLQIMSFKSSLISTVLETGAKEKTIRNDVSIKELQHTIVGSFRLLLHKWRLNNFEFDLPNAGKTMMATLGTLIIKP